MIYAKALLTLAMGMGWNVHAQQTKSSDAQTKIKIEDTKEKNKVSGDIDQEITNAKLRAESGSKSKWSLSTTLQYKGGAINQAFGANRPNLSGQPGNEVSTAVSINPNVRYRWTKNNSLTLGNSFAVMTPFQGGGGKNKKQFNLRDPDVGFSRVGKFGSLQTNGSVAVSVGTSNESKRVEKTGNVGVGWTFLQTFNRLTVGTSAQAYWNVYSSKPGQNAKSQQDIAGAIKKGLMDPGFYGNDTRDQWNLGIYPFVEYAFNDRFAFRTLFGYFNWQHLYGDPNKFRLLQTFVYQSVGVNISITRDIYLYPNVQFVPDNIRSDFTNVALNAIINVF